MSDDLVIYLETPYKSLQPFSGVKLPRFAIITGQNGTGKSHLLEALSKGVAIAAGISPNKVAIYNSSDFRPEFGSPDWRQELDRSSKLAKAIAESFRRIRQQLESMLPPDTQLKDVAPDIESTSPPAHLAELKNHFDKIRHGISRDASISGDRYAAESKLLTTFGLGAIFMPTTEIEIQLARITKPDDPFKPAINSIVNEYISRFNLNIINRHHRISPDSALSDEQFAATFGPPPWDTINEALQQGNDPVQLMQPDITGQVPYSARLSHRNGSEIQFDDLSSGERIAVGLAIASYQITRRANEQVSLLLFDEIDAALHPSLIRRMLYSIQNLFVDRNKCVIMTTHSPTTVALAPDSSLYVMENGSLAATTKDGALGTLLEGVPSLSIEYENRRIVFVEGKYDRTVFEKIFNSLRPQLHPDITLQFLVGKSESCRTVVDTIVKDLRRAGLKRVWGIVDEDNSPPEQTHLMYLTGRYAIENFILDPLVMALYLPRFSVAPQSLGFPKDVEISDIKHPDCQWRQHVVDSILGQLGLAEGDRFKAEYCGGLKATIPTAFSKIRGHDLEKLYKTQFSPLRRHQRDGEMLVDISDMLIHEHRAVIPAEFLQLFKDLQQATEDSEATS